MRKLASIQKIIDIEPIEGKDRIELATILGWKVIIQKGRFKIDDLCVYCEVDSILPEKPEFEFLRSRCWSKKWKGFRIKAMKMGGVISYGIVFPLDILPKHYINQIKIHSKNEFIGLDCTKILNIKKYDPQLTTENKIKERKSKNPIIRFLFKFKIFRHIFLSKHIKLPFPTHLVPKTDETRIQAIPFILDKYKEIECYITEKLDGQSSTYVYNKNRFMVCSRNIEVVNKDSHYWKMADRYNIKDILKNTNLAIQGEIIGHSANAAGRNIYMSELDFYVFNVINTKNRECLTLPEIINFCNKYNLKMVPVLNTSYILGNDTVDELIEMSKGMSKIYDVEREGIVIRDIENKYRPIRGVGDRLSFKVINPDFLLKYCNK